MEEVSQELELPGFRFHPTEEELVDFYLRNMLHGKKLRYDVIRFLNIYHHDPSELPGLARLGEREWYFFVPRDRKHGSGGRPNRTTKNGFWKATGSDRRIVSLSDHKRVIGLRKTLVFYEGRAPRGHKTDWVMNEYRVPDNSEYRGPDNSCSSKDVVLCKIYKKATSFKVLEQRAAMEEAIKISNQSSVDTASAYTCPYDATLPPSEDNIVVLKQEEEVAQTRAEEVKKHSGTSSQMWPRLGRESLPELLVPRLPVSDWTQDSFWTQLNSHWLSNLMATPHGNTMNFLAN